MLSAATDRSDFWLARIVFLFASFFFALVTASYSRAAEESGTSAIHHHESPNHLSLFLGNTHLLVPGEGNEDGFTAGLDYEYRLSRVFGVGGVAEYASGALDATTLLVALDIHLYKGAVLQLGAGVEFIEGHTNELGRVGILYEFEFGEVTVSPQFHFDYTSAEDSLVFGFALGRNF